MMMKSVGETMVISIVNPKCPTPTRLLEGEDIVWSFMKVNVRTMAKEMMEPNKEFYSCTSSTSNVGSSKSNTARSVTTSCGN